MVYAGIGRRALATVVDGLIWIVLLYVVVYATGDRTLGQLGLGGNALWLGLGLLYYILMEALLGATLGKLLFGMRVVKADGSRLDWGSALVRNLLRVVDGLFAYLVGAIL